MFKNIIAPIQAWLLATGKCVGCGRSLEKAKRVKWREGSEKVFCRCGRVFIYDERTKKYRRALIKEV